MATPMWESFWSQDRTAVLWWSFASFICSVFLCICYLLLPQVRRTPGWLIMRASMCDSLLSLTLMLLFFAGRETSFQYQGERYTYMWALSLVTAGCETSAQSWRLMMYIHLVSTYRNPFRPGKSRLVYHLVTASLGALTAGLCAVQFATVDEDDAESQSHAYFLVLACGLIFVPFVMLVLVGGILCTAVRLLVSGALQAASTSGLPASISVLARQRVMRHGLAYLVLHGTVLTLALVCTVLLYYWHSEHPWLWHVLVVLTCGRPVWTLLGWLIINDVIYSLCGVCSFTKPIREVRMVRARSSPDVARGALLRRLRPASAPQLSSLDAVARISTTPRRAATPDELHEDRLDLSFLGERAGLRSVREFRGQPIRASDAMELRAVRSQGIEGCFKEELRFELLYDVVRDIGELANQEMWDDGRGSTASTTSAASDLRQALCMDRPGSLIVPGTRSDGLHFMNLRRQSRRLEQRRPAPTNYGVPEFRKLRAAFGITPQAYARAFPNDLSESDPTWRRRLRESLSEGASGSFFYRVLSGSSSGESSQFMVKQITRSQKDELMAILPAYQEHVKRRCGRSLVQYLGCHAVSLRWQCAGKVYFVVMRNFVPIKAWLTFDLKGATANRRALDPNCLHQIHPGEEPGEGNAYGTLRDWEWMDIAMSVHLSDGDKAELYEMISADADFLSSQGLLDYSLLVGIHRLPRELTANQREERLNQLKAMGGYVSFDRQKVYFFGIIDVLERYSLRWRVQRAVLTAAYHLSCQGSAADGISALAPHEYADRFRTFVSSEVLRISPAAAAAALSSAAAQAATSPGASPGTLRSNARWGQLWRRQRRGLIRERIECESADQRRRIEELEEAIAVARTFNDPSPALVAAPEAAD